MPIARFQMPDGRVARFDVPEGTTPEQAQAQFQAMVQGQQLTQPAQTPISEEQKRAAFRFAASQATPETRAQAVQQVSAAPSLGEVPVSPAAEVGAGEAALIGAGRGLTTIGRAVGLAAPEQPQVAQAIGQLEEKHPVAFGAGEIAGEAAPFLVPGLGVAGLSARGAQVAGAAGLGAAEAGLIARGKGESIDQQLLSSGIGGTLAGALDLAIPVVGRIGGKVVRRFLGKAPDGAVIDAAGKPSDELLDALSESGQTFDDIIDEAKDELLKKPVDPRQASRQAFLKSQGIEPTQAQVTRNAADFQAQQEAAKTSGRVRAALEKQEATLTTRFNNAVLETGGSATTPTSTVFDSLTEKATRLDQEIGELYTAARQAAPDAKNISFNKLTDTLRKFEAADRRAGGNISAIIGDMQSKGILSDQKKVVGRVGVEFAEDLRKLTNELYDPANPFGNMLLRKVKDSLDDDVFNAAGKDFFKQARDSKAAFEKGLSRAQISKFDSRKDNIVRDMLENKIDPDQMIDKVVFGKRWRPDDLKQLKDYISTDEGGKQAFNDMRAEVMQKIADKSFIGAADEAGFQALSRDKLGKALQAIGTKKMEVLFSGKERKFLSDMLTTAALREPVRGTALGRGPSAQAVLSLERKLKELPVIGGIFDVVDVEGRMALRAKPATIRRPTLASPARAAAIAPAVAAAQPPEEK